MRRFSADSLLTAVALLFHAVGLGLVLAGRAGVFRHTTPLHLLLMAALMVAAHRRQRPRFAGWALLAAVLTFAAEWTGVHTGLLFGDYAYGGGLGPRWLEIPLLIGVNWALVVAGAVSLAARLVRTPWLRVPVAALLATAYDYVLEPVAIRLDWWSWQGAIPLYNYLCWAGLAALLAWLLLKFGVRPNQFAVNLFAMQILFFLLLQMLL